MTLHLGTSLPGLQVMTDQAAGTASSLAGWAPVAVAPGMLAAATSYVTGLAAPLTAGPAGFAILPCDAAGNPLLQDSQARIGVNATHVPRSASSPHHAVESIA